MAIKELRSTLLGTDIIRIINQGLSLEQNFKCEISIHTKGVKSSTEGIGDVDRLKLKLTRLDIIRNFLGAYTDNFVAYATMAGGTFVKFILSQREMLEADFELSTLDENGKIININWRMRAFILNIANKDLTDDAINKLSIEELNNLGMIDVSFQLVCRELEAFRTGVCAFAPKDMTLINGLKSGIAMWKNDYKPKVDGKEINFVLKVAKTARSETYFETFPPLILTEKIVGVPQGIINRLPSVLELPMVYDRRQLYWGGVSSYIHKPMPNDKEKDKDCIYSIFETLPYLDNTNNGGSGPASFTETVDTTKAKKPYKELDNREVHILFTNEPALLDNNLYTYGKDGDIVYILPQSTGAKSTSKNVEASITTTSVDIVGVSADANRAGTRMEGSKAIRCNNKNIMKSNLAAPRSGEAVKTKVMVPPLGSFANGGTSYAERATTFTFKWQYGNPFIIKPYNVATLKILAKDNMIQEWTGMITTLFFTYDFTRTHANSIVTFAGFLTDMIEGEV